MFDHKNDQVIRETEHKLHWPNQPDLVSMARIKDAASLEPPSRLIYQRITLSEHTMKVMVIYLGLQSLRFCLLLANRSLVFPNHYMCKQNLDEKNPDEYI